MSRLSRTTHVVALLFSTITVSATAAAQTSTISGRVIASDSRVALVDTRVSIISGTRTVATANTVADGRYSISGVPYGSYDLVARQLGHAPRRMIGLVV